MAQYGPALIDTIIVYVQLKDRKNAEEAMEAAVVDGTMLKSHPKLSQIREYMDMLDEAHALRQEGQNVDDPKALGKLSRHGQPAHPPKAMRSNKTPPGSVNMPDLAVDVEKVRGGDAIPSDQSRGMSREEALKTAKAKYNEMNEEDYHILESKKIKKQRSEPR